MICSLPGVDISAGSEPFCALMGQKLKGSRTPILLPQKQSSSVAIPHDNLLEKRNRMSTMVRAVCICSLMIFTSVAGIAQSTQTESESPAAPSPSHSEWNGESGMVGVGVKFSLLGAGAEVAVRVSHRSNVRAGFNMITYDRTFNKDGISYDGQIQFKSIEAHYDFFPWAGNFHVSPGVLAYIGDPIIADASVPANQSFSLGGFTYYSDPANPAHGNGKINFNQAAPTVTVGWGNLVPRRASKHFSIPFEIGAAFQGSPKATLNLAGNVCVTAPGVNCVNAATDPTVQSNVVAEQNKVNNDLSFFRVYPLISIGVGYKF